jgi:hypothetical protein
MIGAPFAHVAGLPIEETLGAFGPAFLVALGVTWAKLRARLRPGSLSRPRAKRATDPSQVQPRHDQVAP